MGIGAGILRHYAHSRKSITESHSKKHRVRVQPQGDDAVAMRPRCGCHDGNGPERTSLAAEVEQPGRPSGSTCVAQAVADAANCSHRHTALEVHMQFRHRLSGQLSKLPGHSCNLGLSKCTGVTEIQRTLGVLQPNGRGLQKRLHTPVMQVPQPPVPYHAVTLTGHAGTEEGNCHNIT